MATYTTKDIKNLSMAEYKGCPLHGYLLSIKWDSAYTKEEGAGVGRTLDKMFYSIDVGRDGVVYQFHHRDHNQAMRLLKSMYVFLRYSTQSPLKSV
jgi:hypothetical protein